MMCHVRALPPRAPSRALSRPLSRQAPPPPPAGAARRRNGFVHIMFLSRMSSSPCSVAVRNAAPADPSPGRERGANRDWRAPAFPDTAAGSGFFESRRSTEAYEAMFENLIEQNFRKDTSSPGI